ncbi:hypothetical protein [Streptomyces sp. NBC_00083]|uniref:hypothetical protein n=1 Tax=Streptomyces sp. NBC_00083 TaxID=2975647 RepID=UPI00225961A6|nr:hypothetical protein [Streptomyces sp. NBC_00083]MCX5387353.1 hypothetical protein [Streptomyces sp. NBC_00083]
MLSTAALALTGSAAAASPGEEPCRISVGTAVIRHTPSKTAPKAGVGRLDQKCRFHGYSRDVNWAHITMKGSGVDGWVDRHSVSTAKEELAPSGP